MGCDDSGIVNNYEPIRFRHDYFKLLKDIDFVIEVMNRSVGPFVGCESGTDRDIWFQVATAVKEARKIQDYCNSIVAPNADFLFKPQSGMVSTSEQDQNLTFENVLPEDEISVPMYRDPLRSMMDDETATLQNYMMRPVKIHEYTWTLGGGTDFVINPWKLFFENKRVINRITTFNLLKCDLKVRVTVNGTPFHFGRALVSYLPLHTWDSLSIKTVPIQTRDLISISQRPRLFVNPTCSMGGEMVLPFFWHKNYLKIPDSEWDDMGLLMFNEINTLVHANGALDPVTVTIFAWAENFDMSILTSEQSTALIAQSGKTETQEANEKGIISGPASTIAKTVSKLSVFPQIAPLALPTSMAISAIGDIASYFGYSKPTITKSPEIMRPQPSSTFALCNVADTASKLTVDHQQELTVDPRISGVGLSDPMTISDIAQRESYLTQFTWAQADAPEDLLFNMRVTPALWDKFGQETHMPPMAAVSYPFEWWTGSIRVRLQFVTSAYHRGRVRVMYDPNIIAVSEYNTNYSEILDISEQSDFTFEIGMGQEKNLLQLYGVSQAASNILFNTLPLGTGTIQDNGILSVKVLNELTTPSTTPNDIQVNVFVSAGKDFEVFVPSDKFQDFVMKPQSGAAGTPIDKSCMLSDGGPIKTLCIGQTNHEDLNKIYVGESVVSLRSLLRRYNLHESMYQALSGGFKCLLLTRAAFPFYRGNITGAVHKATGPVDYNFCNTVLLHWVAAMFSGHRGSIRYKIVTSGATANTLITASRANRDFWLNEELTQSTTTNLNTGSRDSVYGAVTLDSPPLGLLGSAVTHSLVNPILEYEVPYYNDIRFCPGKYTNFTDNVVSFYNGHEVYVNGISGSTYRVHAYVAAGEDFQTFFFTGFPPVYLETSPPAGYVPP